MRRLGGKGGWGWVRGGGGCLPCGYLEVCVP